MFLPALGVVVAILEYVLGEPVRVEVNSLGFGPHTLSRDPRDRDVEAERFYSVLQSVNVIENWTSCLMFGLVSCISCARVAGKKARPRSWY